MEKHPQEVFYITKMFSRPLRCESLKANVRRCSVENVFSKKKKILGRPATLLKNRLQHRCFPVKYFEIFESTFITEHLRTTAFEDSHRGLAFGRFNFSFLRSVF